MATKSKLRKILLNRQVILLLLVLLVAFIAINPNPWREGIAIQSVEKGSAAELAGVKSGQEIIAINGQAVKTPEEFSALTANFFANTSLLLETENAFYKITAPAATNLTNTTAQQQPVLGIMVDELPKTRIRTGLDLQGGTRVLLEPAEQISETDMELLIANLNQRLNLFGLSDVTVRDASDFGGNQYILVEMAGVNEAQVKDLVSRQGKFEAKVGNASVFKGSDVVDVCRAAHCSGIDFQQGGCQQGQGGPSNWWCPFFFTISLTPEAAQRQANATKDLTVINQYLSEKLYLYLDDGLVDELNIGATLKGQPTVSVQISGVGEGVTQNAASKDAIKNMKQLQTILITGSLPVRLNVVRTDSVSPLLGEEFARNALLTGLIAVGAVTLILLVAYRNIRIALPIMMTSLMEIFLLLGLAALIGWTIDLAAIAGIIAAVGTGVNDQIIITDEALRGQARRLQSWKEKLKSAFSVIFGAYFTLLFTMLPLFVIGAGLLRGFALTTIIGMTVGVLITRPAYARIIEILMEK